jgi:hypothetical protein
VISIAVNLLQGVKARVESIVNSRNGPYATAKSRWFKGSITFSLSPPVWNEEKHPVPGTFVYLDVETRHAGWRATFGRPWRQSDQQGQEPKQTKQPTKSARKRS